MEEHLTVICPVTGYPTHFSCLVCPVTGQIDPAFKNSYKTLSISYFNQQVTLVEIVTFLFVFEIVLASIFSIYLLSLHNRNNCRYGETMFVIITLHNDNNRNGE